METFLKVVKEADMSDWHDGLRYEDMRAADMLT